MQDFAAPPTVPQTQTTEEAMAEAQAHAQGRQDVITLAKACRGSLMHVIIDPLNNGFLVTMRPVNLELVPRSFVFTRADKIGTLMHTLFNSDLDKPTAVARLRRLLGYL